MPRLVGKKSNNGLVPGLLIVAVAGVAGYLEYFGIIDVVPDFGMSKSYISGVYTPNDSNLLVNPQK